MKKKLKRTPDRLSEWGRQGGLMRARRLTKARRRAIAKLAVKAREEKRLQRALDSE